MVGYGKPRWPNTVFFGSYRELNYRIDLSAKPENFFRLRTHSGPGFRLELVRWAEAPGFRARGYLSRAARSCWLESGESRDTIARLLEVHFSRLVTRPETIECYCYPARDDVLPEGGQLSWCLSLVYGLWSAVPEESRGFLAKADFIE